MDSDGSPRNSPSKRKTSGLKQKGAIKKIKAKKTSKSKKDKPKCCGSVGCRRQCLIKVTKSVRGSLRQLVKNAIAVDGHGKCGDFLRQYMIGRAIKDFKETSNQNRKVIWHYYIPVPAPTTHKLSNEPTELVEVCMVAFKEIFGVTERYLRTTRQYERALIRKESMPIKNKKGKRRSLQDVQVEIKDHTKKCSDWTELKDVFNWSLFQIQDETIMKLFDEGFTSLLAISCLQEDDLKYFRLTTNVNLGQLVLLREVIKSLNYSTDNDAPSQSSISSTESPMVIPIKINVSAEQAAMLQGSPSPSEDQVLDLEPVEVEIAERISGNEASGGDQSGGEDEDAESSSSDDDSDDE